MDYSYWKKQTSTEPLFPNIEWSKPEQKSQAGKLGIVGGNKLGFISVAQGYETALRQGVGEVKILLPDALKKDLPKALSDATFGASTQSGGLSREASPEIKALGEWSDTVLLIGDAGRNSETSLVYEDFIREFEGNLVVTRDAIDLIKNDIAAVIERPKTNLVVSFAQLQKIFQTVYYPKVLTFSMQLTQLVETLHKFTITYPVTLNVFHQDMILTAHEGQVVTTPFSEPTLIWNGFLATRIAAYTTWFPLKTAEASATAVL